MAGEIAVDKVREHVTLSLIVREVLMESVAEPGETFSDVAARVLEERTVEYRISKAGLEKVLAKVKKNYEDRMAKRALNSKKKGKLK